jgi:hypothetical protein
MAQRAAAGLVLPLPDSLDEVTTAAIVNPGVGAWLALTRRAALQRSSGLEILGSGPDTIPLSEITGAIPEFMAIGDLPIEIDEVPVAEVEAAWRRSDSGRGSSAGPNRGRLRIASSAVGRAKPVLPGDEVKVPGGCAELGPLRGRVSVVQSGRGLGQL